MLESALDREHSELGPSVAHRYRRCPGSIRMSRGLPNTAGIEAALGTVFHEFAALTLEFDVNQYAMIGSQMEVDDHGVLEFTREMAYKMQPGIDLYRSLEGPDTISLVEKRLDLSPWLGEGEIGTADGGIIDLANHRLVGFDWKWGQGVAVQPDWNDQVILYMLGLWNTHAEAIFRDHYDNTVSPDYEDGPDLAEIEEYKADWLEFVETIEVLIIIEQPRADGGGGIWKTDMETILAEGAKIKMDANATRDPDAPLVPGTKQCQFCPAARYQTCPAHRDFILGAFDIALDDLETAALSGEMLELRDRKALSPEARSHLLLHKSMIESYLKDLHADAFIDAENGVDVPGMFLAVGRNPPRKWKDETKAEYIMTKRLGEEEAFNKKLLSPTQLEEKVGRRTYENDYDQLVDYGDPKPQLVPHDSGKTPVKSRADRMDEAFDDAQNASLI